MMQSWSWLNEHSSFNIAFTFIFGLIIGSFLNLVIYRLPLMLKSSWLQVSADYFQENNLSVPQLPQTTKLNLAWPGSFCPNCESIIKWYQNIPVISFIVLGGKCANCKVAISWQYPIIELITAVLFAYSSYHFGVNLSLLLVFIFLATLIVMSVIDMHTMLLPDELTMGLLWFGLLSVQQGWWPIDLSDSVAGAILGYMFFWVLATIWQLLFKKQAIGNGDFKLLAAVGAWLGWQAILPIVLIASIIGSIVGIIAKLTNKLSSSYIPFGPFLALAAVIVLFFGHEFFYQLFVMV